MQGDRGEQGIAGVSGPNGLRVRFLLYSRAPCGFFLDMKARFPSEFKHGWNLAAISGSYNNILHL